MKNLSLMLVMMGAAIWSGPLSGQTQSTPWQPDADGDHMIGMQDLLKVIAVYGAVDADFDNAYGADDACPEVAGPIDGCPEPSGCEPLYFDGYTYGVVEVSGDCWFAENLRTLHYANGEPIVEANVGSGVWGDYGAEGAWCDFNLDGEWSTTYGRLYNGAAVLDERGLCPTGWHVPSDLEWMGLEAAAGMNESELGATAYRGNKAYVLKDSLAWNGTDSLAWRGMPGGFRSTTGAFLAGGSAGGWWTGSDIVGSEAWFRSMHTNNEGVQRNVFGLHAALSVRCLKN